MSKHLPFALLTPGNHPPRRIDTSRIMRASLLVGSTAEGVWMEDPLHEMLHSGEVLYVDFETRGLNPMNDPDFRVVGLGMCTENLLPIYLGAEGKDDIIALRILCAHLTEHKQYSLVAHNVAFDGMVMFWMASSFVSPIAPSEMTALQVDSFWANWKVCTYGLYRALASEDWIGQKHGLKNAMEDLLGWTDTNEYERDAWLVEHGFSRKQAGKAATGGLPVDVPMKGEMWRVPIPILGQYCAMDCEATMLLHTKVLKPVADRFKGLTHFHEIYFMDLVKNVTWQKLKGVTVQMGGPTGLNVYTESLKEEIRNLKAAFMSHARVRPHLDAFHAEQRATLVASRPASQFKKVDTLKAEPKKFNVSGNLSATWQKWENKRVALEAAPAVTEKTARYVAWEEKLREFDAAVIELYAGEQTKEDETTLVEEE